MPAERTAMRQVRDVLRLKTAGVAINEIARRVGVASSTVRLTLKRLAAAGLGWPLPDLDSRTGFRHREWQKCWRLIKPGQKCGAKL